MSESAENRPMPQTGGRELTSTAVFLGLLLSVVMGAANVYLGLRVGMTVSASIPAAVLAMAILSGIMRRRSILEANLVQTAASAGESLAAGIIFTTPALILVGAWTDFDYWTTTLIAAGGGMLGILFMIPMRRVFIVDNQELLYPEGLACAEVLRAGTQDETAGQSSGLRSILGGLAIGAVFKAAESLLGLIRAHVEWAAHAGGRVAYFGADIAPALVGVGLIVGLPIASQIFIGGAIGWLVTIPLISEPVPGEAAVDTAWRLWSTQVRYLGVGAMVVGGLVSIWRVRSGLRAAISLLFGGDKSAADSTQGTTDRNLSTGTLIVTGLATMGVIYFVYSRLLTSMPLTIVTLAIMTVMAFFFTAVASYIVGLVGNSNSPVSGMTITAVLATGLLIVLFRASGLLNVDADAAILATLGVAGIVCCVACTAGDVCNDLKTGVIVGASPRSQQIMQILGVVAASFVMAPVMQVLHEGSLNAGTGGLGGSEFPAPQAMLFKGLAEGIFGNGDVPWEMVGLGAALGCMLTAGDTLLKGFGSSFRLHVMPVAVGIYLPFGISVPILLGGLMAWRLSRNRSHASARLKKATLWASGLIAGESLTGVGVGFWKYLEANTFDALDAMGLSDGAAQAWSVGVLLVVVAFVFTICMRERDVSADTSTESQRDHDS